LSAELKLTFLALKFNPVLLVDAAFYSLLKGKKKNRKYKKTTFLYEYLLLRVRHL
jgi:hypothetical protein